MYRQLLQRSQMDAAVRKRLLCYNCLMTKPSSAQPTCCRGHSPNVGIPNQVITHRESDRA